MKKLTLSWRRPLSYRNQSIPVQSSLRHERVKTTLSQGCKKSVAYKKHAFFHARWYLQVLLKIKTKTNPFKTSYTKVIRPKKIILLFPEMPVTKKIFTSAVAKKINLTESFKQSLLLKNYSNSDFLCWKTKSPIFYCLKGKKRKFGGTNLLVEIILCVFFKQKCIFSYTFDWCGRVGEKTIFFHPADFGNKTTFFGLRSDITIIYVIM